MKAKTPPDVVDKYVGKRVRMRRIMLGLSQAKVAAALGLAFQQVQKYEKGTNRISSSRLHQLAGILQVQVPFFFDDAPQRLPAPPDKAKSSDSVTEFVTTQDGHRLIKAFMQIRDAELRRKIVDLVEQCAGDD